MTFNEELIAALFTARHRRPDQRNWLRQAIRTERKKRGGS